MCLLEFYFLPLISNSPIKVDDRVRIYVLSGHSLSCLVYRKKCHLKDFSGICKLVKNIYKKKISVFWILCLTNLSRLLQAHTGAAFVSRVVPRVFLLLFLFLRAVATFRCPVETTQSICRLWPYNELPVLKLKDPFIHHTPYSTEDIRIKWFVHISVIDCTPKFFSYIIISFKLESCRTFN